MLGSILGPFIDGSPHVWPAYHLHVAYYAGHDEKSDTIDPGSTNTVTLPGNLEKLRPTTGLSVSHTQLDMAMTGSRLHSRT